MSDPTSLDERDGDVTLLAEEVWQTAQGESRFASAARMRLVHTDLLVRDDETEESAANVREAFLNRAGMFLLVGEKTGAVLDDLDDRWTAQSQLDYWYTVLHRSGKQPQRPKLAPFDEQAVPSLEDQPCPYRGLAAFDTGDREVYFGREKLLKELIARLAEVPLVAVLGSSGSGKSSLMRAGLVPALRSGRFLPGSDQWLMLPMMLPGSNPLLNLAETLLTLHARESGSPPWFQPPSWNPNELAQILLDQPDVLARVFNHETTPPVVLLVDQFEEVFTLCDQPRRTQALLSNLDGFLAARNAGAGGHRIVLTMRSDYEAYLMKYPEFRQAFDRGRVPVTPLEKEELRAAIEEPARRVGLIFEKTLVDRLIDDTFGEPGSLPLLQFTLTRLWQTRRRNKVLMEAYTGLGGARRALATVADSVYEKLILQEREAARRIFLRIVRPGQGLEVTNQRIAEHELFTAGEDHDRISRVLEKLIQEGLIRRTVGLRPEDTQIEVAHEALVRNWPLLVGWLNEERAAIVVRQRLSDKVAEWVRRGRGQDALLDPAQLADAERWRDGADAIKLGTIANLDELIKASRKAEDNRLQKQVRSNRLRRLAYGLSAATAATILLAAFAASQWMKALDAARRADVLTGIARQETKKAERQTRLAESRRLAAASEAVLSERLDRAMLLAVEAVREAVTMEARSSLQRSLSDRPAVSCFLDIPEGKVNRVAIGPEGRIAAGFTSGDWTGGVVLFDASGQRSVPAPLEVKEGSVTSVAIGPDGRIAAGYVARGGNGGVALFDASGQRSVPATLEVKEGLTSFVTSVAFGPDGRIAAGYATGGSRGGVVQFDASGKRSVPAWLEVKEGDVSSVAFGPDGRIAAGYEEGGDRHRGGVVLFDASGKPSVPAPLKVKEGRVTSVAFGPDGGIAAGYWKHAGFFIHDPGTGGVVLFDARGQRSGPAPLEVKEGRVSSVAFGLDGRIAAGYWNSDPGTGGVVLFDARGQRSGPAPLEVKEGSVSSVSFGPEGRIAAGYLNRDQRTGGVVLFAAGGQRSVPVPLGVKEGSVNDVSFGPEGRIAAGYFHREPVTGGVVLFDASGQRSVPAPLEVKEGSVRSVVFGPEGRIAAGYWNNDENTGGVVLFDASGQRSVPAPLEMKYHVVNSVSFGLEGRIAAGYEAGGDEGGVVLFEANGQRSVPAPLEVKEGGVMSVATGFDGRIAAGYLNRVQRTGGVVLFDAGGQRRVSAPLEVKEGGVTSVSFGPDGRITAGYSIGGGLGGGVVLFDASGHRSVPAPLEVKEGRVTSVAFGPDGRIAAGYSSADGLGGGVVLFDARGQRFILQALKTDAPVANLTFADVDTVLAAVIRIDDAAFVSFNINLDSWTRRAERTANRNLTWAEWTRYFPEAPYHRTVRSLPWPSDLPEAERLRAEATEQEHLEVNPLTTGSSPVGSLWPPDRQLNPKLEILGSMSEGSTKPGFEARMIVGHVSAAREPRAIEPLQRAKFSIDPAAYLDLGHDHQWEPEPANFPFWGESLGLDRDLVPAVFERRDLGVVPLIVRSRMRKKTRRRARLRSATGRVSEPSNRAPCRAAGASRTRLGLLRQGPGKRGGSGMATASPLGINPAADAVHGDG